MSPGSLPEGGGGYFIPLSTRARLHTLYASSEYCPFLCGSCTPSVRALLDARTSTLARTSSGLGSICTSSGKASPSTSRDGLRGLSSRSLRYPRSLALLALRDTVE